MYDSYSIHYTIYSRLIGKETLTYRGAQFAIVQEFIWNVKCTWVILWVTWSMALCISEK